MISKTILQQTTAIDNKIFKFEAEQNATIRGTG